MRPRRRLPPLRPIPAGRFRRCSAMDGKPPRTPAVPRMRLLCPSRRRGSRGSGLQRLLVRVSASERVAAAGDEKSAAGNMEAGSVGAGTHVLSFREEPAAVAERPLPGRCNCFSGSNYEESDGEEDFFFPFGSHLHRPLPRPAALEALEGWVQSASMEERNLLANASRIAERCGRTCKGKAECRRAVADGLRSLGYDAAVCKSHWEKSPSYAGMCFSGSMFLTVKSRLQAAVYAARCALNTTPCWREPLSGVVGVREAAGKPALDGTREVVDTK